MGFPGRGLKEKGRGDGNETDGFLPPWVEAGRGGEVDRSTFAKISEQ